MEPGWCPRCGLDLRAPSVYESSWRCERHGSVLPLSAFHRTDDATMTHLKRHSEVPVWVPEPLPSGWAMTGLAAVGDHRGRLRGTVAAYSGPAPLGGGGEWLIVAEEPGIGLGAGYAGSGDPDFDQPVPSAAKIHALGHPTPLWPVLDAPNDRGAYVGEAGGVWLWLVCFPADAGYAVLEDLTVVDAREVARAWESEAATSKRLRPHT